MQPVHHRKPAGQVSPVDRRFIEMKAHFCPHRRATESMKGQASPLNLRRHPLEWRLRPSPHKRSSQLGVRRAAEYEACGVCANCHKILSPVHRLRRCYLASITHSTGPFLLQPIPNWPSGQCGQNLKLMPVIMPCRRYLISTGPPMPGRASLP